MDKHYSNNGSHLIDTNFSCPCELCDCGCFEATQQPHSLNCPRLKSLHSQSEVVFNNPNNESEYGLSYKNQDQFKQRSLRVPDSFSFDKRSFLNKDTNSMSRFDNSFEDTSYRNFFSYPITEKQESKSPSKRSSVTFSQPQESRSNPITRLKQEYLKSFDELNSGFNDGFTQSKGKATFISELDAELAGQTAEQRPIHEEVRNLYIPKKYPGRNMFKSHIDSAIFPEKNANHFESQYTRNSIHIANLPSEKRTSFKTSSSIAENVVAKNMGYLRLIDNSFIPLIKMVDPKTINTNKSERSLSFQGESPRTTYMIDYEKQQRNNDDRKCRYKAYKLETQKDNMLSMDYEEKQRQTLYELRKRQNELAQREYNIKI